MNTAHLTPPVPTEHLLRSGIFMNTLVSIEAPDTGSTEGRMVRALQWFSDVERRCSRFDAKSELSSINAHPGRAIAVSPVVYRAIEFALAVAEATSGAFDPTVGRALEQRGVRRNFRTLARSDRGHESYSSGSYRDIQLDPVCQTVLLKRPLVLDLGAVAKGLAIDLAAGELSGLPSFAIYAGGDLYVQGLNVDGRPWQIGIRDPFRPGGTTELLAVTNAAVCTSGNYERSSGHIVSPNDSSLAEMVASATVIAPQAMLADALSTAACVLGPWEGIALLENEGAAGLLVGATGERYVTSNIENYLL